MEEEAHIGVHLARIPNNLFNASLCLHELIRIAGQERHMSSLSHRPQKVERRRGEQAPGGATLETPGATRVRTSFSGEGEDVSTSSF